MYDRLLDPDADHPAAPELFARAEASTSLAEEIRLARTWLGLAVMSADEKSILAWLAMVHTLVRTHGGLSEGADDLTELLGRIGAEIRNEIIAAD